jgi:aminoglycoside phosphotransferase (APT) family kinase protein
MTEHRPLALFLDAFVGDIRPLTVTRMAGGGSCEVFALDRGGEHWVLRRAPARASSSTAHDVLREFGILDAIKDTTVRIPRPVVACGDPSVFERPFYVMSRVDGVPVRDSVPDGWAAGPDEHGRALEELIDALVEIHAVDWAGVGLGGLGHPEGFLARQVERWLAQLESYGGRPLDAAVELGGWLEANRPPEQPPALFHGDYKLDNVLFARDLPPRLLAVVDWEMASIGDPLIDLAWALIFHPGPEGTLRLGTTGSTRFALEHVPPAAAMVERYAARSGRDVSALGWYDVFARWKLAIVLEGSYAKFLRGATANPVHEFFGRQADLLLASASDLTARTGGPR